MPWRLARQLVLTLAGVVSCQMPAHTQSASPSLIDEPQEAKPCRPAQLRNQPSGSPEVSIVGLSFSGFLQMPVSEQDQIAAFITRQTYPGPLDQVKGEAEQRVRNEWQNRGYFKVEVTSDAHVVSSNSAGERIALSVHVDEGQQYRLRQITFRNNKAVSNVKALRSLFPIKDGDIFSREKVAKGLEKLRNAYGQLGYVNATNVPDTIFDDDNRTISLNVDMDEGKQFRVGNIEIYGADSEPWKDLALKPGDIYNVRLIERFLQKRLPGADVHDPNILKLELDERGGRVAITFDFRSCQSQ